MRRKLSPGFSLLVISMLTPPAVAAETAPPRPRVDVLFSPEGGCEARVIAELGKARKTVRVQAYGFTNPLVARALTDAKGRGVDCEVILDRSNRTDKYSQAAEIRGAGISCLFDDVHPVANNKVIIIDDATIITGSFNFTKAAEASNAENLLVLTGLPEVVKAYAENYAKHREHATPYDQPPPSGALTRGDAAESPASNAPAPAADPRPTAVVYITPSGKKYHRAGCEFLRGGGRRVSVSELDAAKYGPCSKCKP